MSENFPTQSQIVIIGGGIVGCSTAYHLAKLGWKDVVLLERKELGSGTTWAAAGLIAQLRQNQEMSNLAKYATHLYAELEAETSVAPVLTHPVATEVSASTSMRSWKLRLQLLRDGSRPVQSVSVKQKTGGGSG